MPVSVDTSAAAAGFAVSSLALAAVLGSVAGRVWKAGDPAASLACWVGCCLCLGFAAYNAVLAG